MDRGEYRLCSLNNSAQVFEKVSEEDWGRVFRTARYCTARKLPISGRLMSGEEFYINYSLNGEQYSIGLNAVGVVGTKRSYLWHQVQVCMSLARATNDPVLKERYEDLAVDFARNAGRERTSTATNLPTRKTARIVNKSPRAPIGDLCHLFRRVILQFKFFCLPPLNAQPIHHDKPLEIPKHAYSDFGYMAWDRLDNIRMGTLFDVDGKVITRCAIVLESGLFF